MEWKPLLLSPSAAAHLPPLLISSAFTPTSYTIHLTDLTYIWSESLDERAIIRRSRVENTSIDPSDGDQLQILLDKVRLGLKGGNGTTLALTIAADADRPSLSLHITVKLPGGLSPLEWPVRLATRPQSLFRSQLTFPQLRAQHAGTQDIASLVELLRDKDHVIQKLVDILEAQGTELGQIFPQVAGKGGRKLDRKRAEERVKGLGLFDLDAWRRSQDHGTSQDIVQGIGHVFTGDFSKTLDINGEILTPEEAETWWESIKGITVNLDSGKISTNGISRASKTPPKLKLALTKEETIESNDDFQVQATPPRLSAPPKRAASKPVISDSSDDEDDLDAHSQRSKIPDSFPVSPPPALPSPQKPKKLGLIGPKKAGLKFVAPDEESTEGEPSSPCRATPGRDSATQTPGTAPVIPRRKLGRIGGKKKLPPPDSDPEFEVSPQPTTKSPTPEAPRVKKGKLGQIGGKNKGVETFPPSQEAQPEPEASKLLSLQPNQKLGAIGRRHRFPAVQNEDNPSKTEDIENRGRSIVKKEKTPPRETSQERADRKRMQLKRELEEKAKAPVKKRRKF